MTKQTSTGKCALCGGTFSKRAMTKHVTSCKQKESVSETPSGTRTPQKTKSFHLVVEGRYSPEYWLHLEVPVDTGLDVLDDFLRQIWLECCGHMSAFNIEGKTYSVRPMDDFDETDMDIDVGHVLYPGIKFYHEYDFGTTTALALKVVAETEGRNKDKSIQVLARNDPPAIKCLSCGQAATQICTDCSWSGEGWLCDKCAAEHECGEDMLLPVVNSPRVGMCGYTG